MNTEETPTKQEQESSPLYIIGALVIVAVVVAGVLLWPKQALKQTTKTTPIVEEKTMITKLTCDKQWYNPKIGFAEYYLSGEGTALATTKTIDCTFTITTNADGKVVATEKMPAVLTPATERGGQTYRCTTKAVALTKGANVTMATMVKDDVGTTASCAAGTITLP